MQGELEGYNIEELKTKVLAKLDQDLANMNLLMRVLGDKFKDEITHMYPLKFNKNILALEGAKKLVESDFSALTSSSLSDHFKMDPNALTILRGNDGDIKGTPVPNFIQTALLTTLCVVKDAKSLQHLDELLKTGDINIYQADSSPNIQTTALPPSFKLETDCPELKDWFYYYVDAKSPSQGELLVPGLGYAYGGSRYDSRYNDKVLKTEDCSSSIAKWVGIEGAVWTGLLKEVHSGASHEDRILNKMTALEKGAEIKPGDVFVRGAHTGLVSQVLRDDNGLKIEVISYNRDIPTNMEGLGYNEEGITDGHIFFRPLAELVQDGQVHEV